MGTFVKSKSWRDQVPRPCSGVRTSRRTRGNGRNLHRDPAHERETWTVDLPFFDFGSDDSDTEKDSEDNESTSQCRTQDEDNGMSRGRVG